MKISRQKPASVDTAHSSHIFSTQNLPAIMALIAVCGLYIYHFYFVWSYAVDVPYRDEWDAIGGLSQNFSLEWLFRWHNEHRLVTTKLLIWILYKLNHWDLVIHQVINFLTFGVLLFTLGRWAQKRMPDISAWAVTAFLLFLLSPLLYENHLMGYQSQVHFALLFFVAAVYFLFDEAQHWPNMLLGSLMAVLSIYSLSSGVATSLVILLLFAPFKVLRLRQGTVERKRELIQLCVVGLIVLTAIALWSIGYHKPPNAAPNALPFTGIFWDYFLNIVSLGFGIETLSPWPGVLCLLIVLVPILGDIIKRRATLPAANWGLCAGVFGVLSVLAIIAMGRAIGFGVAQSKSSRYAEIGMLLIPMSVMAWSSYLRDKPKIKAGVLSALWLFCFVTFLHTWSYFSIYRAQYTERTAGIECVERYYDGKGRGRCKALYPGPIPDKLDLARELDLSFYRTLRSDKTNHLNDQP